MSKLVKAKHRKYSNGGKNISTIVKNSSNGKEYLVSTATDNQVPVWQLAVFAWDNNMANVYKPLLFKTTFDFDKAEKLHVEIEKLIQENPESEWVQTNIRMQART